MPTLPINLTVAGKNCLVVGGGPVARRKLRALLEAGARPRVVALEPQPADLPEALHWLQEPYRSTHLNGVALVFAAATPEVNSRVVSDARTLSVWVNSASDPTAGDFALPAVRRLGRIEVAVGTSGASPVLAGRIADQLADELDAALASWVDLLAELRDNVRAVPSERRADVLRQLCDPAWHERIRELGPDVVRDEMRAVIG